MSTELCTLHFCLVSSRAFYHCRRKPHTHYRHSPSPSSALQTLGTANRLSLWLCLFGDFTLPWWLCYLRINIISAALSFWGCRINGIIQVTFHSFTHHNVFKFNPCHSMYFMPFYGLVFCEYVCVYIYKHFICLSADTCLRFPTSGYYK